MKEAQLDSKKESKNYDNSIGFNWWYFYGIVNISFGSIIITNYTANYGSNLMILLLIVNAVLMLLVLKLNKYAFLISTVLSFNPLLWIINGIYLKNRWNHPKVNPKDYNVIHEIAKPNNEFEASTNLNLKPNFEDELEKKIDLVFSFNALDSIEKKERISNLIDSYKDRVKESKLNALRVKYRIEIKADERANEISLNQIDEEPKLSTIANPINWYKYTKLVINAEKKFQDIYNFEVPNEHKNYDRILSLAFCILFEEMRLNKVLPDDAIYIMQSIREKSNFYNYITPVGKDMVNWKIYKTIYEEYIDQRALRERPIIATIIAMNSIENPISEEDKKTLRKEFDKNPIFGINV